LPQEMYVFIQKILANFTHFGCTITLFQSPHGEKQDFINVYMPMWCF